MVGMQRMRRAGRNAAMSAALGLAAAGLAACGSSSDPGASVKAYLTALANGDAKTACQQIDQQLLNRLLQSAGGAASGTSCTTLVTLGAQRLTPAQKQQLRSAKVTGTSISGNTAQVTVTAGGSTRTLKLTKSGGKWVISGGVGSSSSTPSTPGTTT